MRVRQQRAPAVRVLVVTGAASGIGRATARRFHAAGVRVHGVDVDEAGLATLAAEIGDGFWPHRADCRDPRAMADLAEAVFDREGRVDVLHNNAGVVVCGRAVELALEDWRYAIDVNLLGVVHGVQAFVPRMARQGGGGHVVNTASISGLLGFPLCGPYSASKFAVVGLSECLDAELAPQGIRVTALCPGMVDTAVMENGRLGLPGRGQALLRAAVARFALSPEEVGTAVWEVVRRRRGGIRVLGMGTRPLWWLRRQSPAGFGVAMSALSRWFLPPLDAEHPLPPLDAEHHLPPLDAEHHLPPLDAEHHLPPQEAP